MVTLLVLALCQPAAASRLFVGASGGIETAAGQQWAGLDVALWGSQDRGLEPVGRVAAGLHLGGGPMSILEAGFAMHVPEDEATVRFGMLARGVLLGDASTYPIEFNQGDWRSGIIPAGLLFFELQYGNEGKLGGTVGFKGGLGSRPVTTFCTDDEALVDCLVWGSGFHGGFYGRIMLPSMIAAELTVGPTVQLSIGRAFR